MYMIASTHVSYPLDITQDPSRAANTTVTPKMDEAENGQVVQFFLDRYIF